MIDRAISMGGCAHSARLQGFPKLGGEAVGSCVSQRKLPMAGRAGLAGLAQKFSAFGIGERVRICIDRIYQGAIRCERR